MVSSTTFWVNWTCWTA